MVSLYLILLLFVVNVYSNNNTTTIMESTYYPVTSTMFHTTSTTDNNNEYFIVLNVTIIFECSNDTNIICPSLEDIEEIFKNTLNEMENILSSFNIDQLEYDDNDTIITIDIISTIYTMDPNDFILSNFTQILEGQSIYYNYFVNY